MTISLRNFELVEISSTMPPETILALDYINRKKIKGAAKIHLKNKQQSAIVSLQTIPWYNVGMQCQETKSNHLINIFLIYLTR